MSQLFLPYYVFVSVSLFLFLALSVSLHTHIQTHIHTGTCTKKNIHHVQNTHASHTTFTNIHARTHAHILAQQKRPKRSNRNWKQIPCAPQNLPKFSFQVSFSSSSFTSTGQSIFSCCWRSQVRPCAAAINAPCPTGDYRHHRVSQQPSIAKKTSPSATETPPRASKIQQERKETEERISEVPPRGVSQASLCLQACACAPVNKTDHQCWTAKDGHARRRRQLHTSTRSRTSRDFSRTRRETCARAVVTLPKSRPNYSPFQKNWALTTTTCRLIRTQTVARP